LGVGGVGGVYVWVGMVAREEGSFGWCLSVCRGSSRFGVLGLQRFKGTAGTILYDPVTPDDPVTGSEGPYEGHFPRGGTPVHT
jgi:hypothetical protein